MHTQLAVRKKFFFIVFANILINNHPVDPGTSYCSSDGHAMIRNRHNIGCRLSHYLTALGYFKGTSTLASAYQLSNFFFPRNVYYYADCIFRTFFLIAEGRYSFRFPRRLGKACFEAYLITLVASGGGRSGEFKTEFTLIKE